MKPIATQLIISNISARKDGSLRLSAETPELNSEQKVCFIDLQNAVLRAIFQPEGATDEPIKVDKDVERKSQSQRIRSVLFLLWKKDPGGIEFADFYQRKTEKYIDFLKEKLED